MTSTDPQTPAPPTAKQLARATLLAAGVAAIVLVTTILPAEYGIDPLRTGAAWGLIRPRQAEEPPASAPSADGKLRFDRIQFELGPYDFVEYKYRLEQGANMVFSWEASAPVMNDFHGVPDTDHDKEISFSKQERRSHASAHAAPFSGVHGFFWENLGPDPVTVTLGSSGFYSAAIEYRSNGTRRTHELKEQP